MTDEPKTLTRALDGLGIADSHCLEAGAGAGNASAALADRGAAAVYAVTDDAGHAATVADRFANEAIVRPLRADLRSIPLPDDAVEVVTAHGLFNVVPTPAATPTVSELTRVTSPGGQVVVVDYEPVDGPVRDLFAVGNAVAELADGRPTYTFYPRSHLRGLFEAAGWRPEDSRIVLEPVPWTGELLDSHVDLIAEGSESLPDVLGAPLRQRLDAVRTRAGEGVETGEMYAEVLTFPE